MDEEARELLWTILRRQQAQHDQVEYAIRLLHEIKQEIRKMDTATRTALGNLSSVDGQVAAAVSSVVAEVAAQNSTIGSLTAQIAAGQTPDQGVLDGINAAVTQQQQTLATLASALPPASPPASTVSGGA